MLYSTLQEFEERLAAAGLNLYAEMLLRESLPCLVGSAEPLKEPLEVGTSRIGGAPDLPAEIPWPACSRIDLAGSNFTQTQTAACRLHFIAQLNCNELMGAGIAAPENSVISIFAALHRSNFPHTGGTGDDWMVMCFPLEQAVRREPPLWTEAGACAISMEYEELTRTGRASIQPARLQMRRCWSLPLQTLETRVEANESWAEAHSPKRDLIRKTEIQMQFPMVVGGNCMNLETGIASHPIEVACDFLKNKGINSDASDGGNESWVNLASLPSMPDIDLIWNWFGRGVFMIPRQDLKIGDVSRAVLVSHIS